MSIFIETTSKEKLAKSFKNEIREYKRQIKEMLTNYDSHRLNKDIFRKILNYIVEIVHSSEICFANIKKTFPMIELCEMDDLIEVEDEPQVFEMNICEKIGQIYFQSLSKTVVCPQSIPDWTDVCLNLIPVEKNHIWLLWDNLLKEDIKIEHPEEIITTLNQTLCFTLFSAAHEINLLDYLIK